MLISATTSDQLLAVSARPSWDMPRDTALETPVAQRAGVSFAPQS